MTTDSDSKVLLAILGAAHGIKGEIRANVFTADPASIGDYGPLMDADGGRYTVRRARPSKGGVILSLEGIPDRSAAEALKGVELFVARECLPDDALEEDEFYQSDLVGLVVLDASGRTYGAVVAIHDFGAGIVLELQPEEGATQMIPFSEAAVPEVDLRAGRILIDPIAAGLSDTESEKPKSGSRRRRPTKKTAERP